MSTVSGTVVVSLGDVIIWSVPMNFPTRLALLRKNQGYSQQRLADAVGMHINQIKRYETDAAQPTLEALVKLAKALHVSLDALVFEEDERGPGDDLRLQFEAVSQLLEGEQAVVREVLEGLIIKYQTRRWDQARGAKAAAGVK
jgi:transcriptional regulator with XRE-family HTH domain